MKTILITAALISLVSAPLLPGQGAGGSAPVDPYAPKGEKPAAPGGGADAGPPNLSLCFETYSVPLAEAAKLRREHASDAELYTLFSEGKAKDGRQETFTIVRTLSGNKAISEAAVSTLCPSSYEPPELPNQVGISIAGPTPKDSPAPPVEAGKLDQAPTLSQIGGVRTPATPTTWLIQKSGLTVEVDATAAEDGKSVQIVGNMMIDTPAGRQTWGQELSTVEMGVNETQSIQTNAVVSVNQPYLCGTINRSPSSTLDPDSPKRVWFAFVTVTRPKP